MAFGTRRHLPRFCLTCAVGIQPIFDLPGKGGLPLGSGKFQGLPGRGHGLGGLLHAVIGQGQIEIGVGELGFQAQGLHANVRLRP